MVKLKVLGLIGGVSWASTVEYYRIINEEANKRLGGINTIECIVYSLNLGELKEYQDKDDWKSVANILLDAARKLERAGAEGIIICANTMHKVADYIEEDISIPLIHIVDATAKEIIKKKVRYVGLLGTKFTMEESFYRDRLKKYGISTIVPEPKDREVVNNIIYNELCKGIIREESKTTVISIIKKLVKKGAEGVILGCTELPLLIKQKDVDIPIFDTTMIHAKAAVNYALS